MMQLIKSLPLLFLIAMGAPSFAQSTDGETTPPSEEEAVPNPLELSMGQEETNTAPLDSGVYILSEHGDWQIRCIKTEDSKDPCQMYQLLNDPSGNPVAEINIFPVGGEGRPAAGATVITPLETLLTQQLGVSVDGGPVKKFPFSWCSTVGCFSRIGFADSDINSFKRGVNATLTIVPVAAPDQKVRLQVSLTGFTAGFAAAVEAQPK